MLENSLFYFISFGADAVEDQDGFVGYDIMCIRFHIFLFQYYYLTD